MRRAVLLVFVLAGCASPQPSAPPAPRTNPERAVCRDPVGQVGRIDPRVGSQTGLPVPRPLYTRRATMFRAGPRSEEAELFTLERPSAVMILQECGFYRLARVPDGRTGWVRASALTTYAPRASP